MLAGEHHYPDRSLRLWWRDIAEYQTDAFGVPAPPEDLVKLFWELQGLDALCHERDGYRSAGKVTKEWLEETFQRVGEVIGESVKAGAECGSFGLQLVPNAFEVSDSTMTRTECYAEHEGEGH